MVYNNKKGVLLVSSFLFLLFVLLILSKQSKNNLEPEVVDIVSVTNTSEQKIGLAENAFNDNNLDEAISIAKKIVVENKDDVDALKLLGTSFLQKGSLEFKEKEYAEKGLEIADKILVIDEASDEAYLIKGYAYEIMQEYDESIEAYNKGIELNNLNIALYNHRGHAYYLMGDLENANIDVDKSLEIDPNDYFALITKGKYLLESDNDIEAEIKLNKALESESDLNNRLKAEVYQLLGLIKLKAKDYDGAIEKFKKSTELDDSLVGGWTGLADATYFSLAESDDDMFVVKFIEALGYAQKAIDIYEDCSTAYVIMAKIMHLDESTNEAVKNIIIQAELVVDKDITLNTIQKEKVKADIATLKTEWNLN